MSAPSDRALASGVALPDAPAVLGLLAGYLATDLGRSELDRLRFHRDPAELAALHARLAEAQLWRLRRGAFAFARLEADPAPLLARAAAGLEAAELLRLRAYLEAASALRDHLLAADDEASEAAAAEPAAWPALAGLAASIPACLSLRQSLQRALLPSGELADDASPELARLRRQRLRQRQAIESVLERQMRTLAADGVLQDELVTVRNERFVLPVRAEQRRRAAGIVHGASSSGQTLFVEPLETVELNNENIRLRDAELAEVQRILAALSAAVSEAAPGIAAGARACAVLELEAAKAAFAHDFAALPAEFTSGTGAVLELCDARHPVLVATLRAQSPPRPVVPLSLRLDEARLLVVSGPNTGGKTVVLKTVGIAVWMAHCGLPVCAAAARLPVCHAIWADIGDVQSLEQSLSTFSSHLLHIRQVLEAADASSLVLLDELGTATNAAEGAALAVEIAAALLARRAWTLISTHHDALKAWAAGHPDTVLNGSVAVDAETLAPTYQFRLGVPGASAGLAMAERLGLPRELVAAARARLGAAERDAALYLESLQRQLAAAEDRLAELSARETEVARREREIAAHDRAHLQRRLDQLRAELDRRLASFTARQEAAWHDALAAVQADATAAQKKKLALAAARLKRETAEVFQTEVASALRGESGESPAAAPSRPPQPGDRVRLRAGSQPARVLRALENGRFEIEAGRLRMQVTAADIAAVLESAPAPGGAIHLPAAPLVRELNLIGLRADEAADQLDRFLDQAILAGADQVRIVHGAGFGVLRRTVADLLRAHPQVAGFEHPPQNQGGQGVTLANLK